MTLYYLASLAVVQKLHQVNVRETSLAALVRDLLVGRDSSCITSRMRRPLTLVHPSKNNMAA